MQSLPRLLPLVGLLGGFFVAATADSGNSLDQLEGTLEIVVEDDFDGGRSSLQHLLHDASTGKRYHLDFPETSLPELESGTAVVLRGRAHDDDSFSVTESIDVEPGGTRSTIRSTGQRNALVIIVDFQDYAVPCSDTMVTDTMFTGTHSVDDLYQESSFGALSFTHDTDADGTPDVIRVSIDAHSTDACDRYLWADQADAVVLSGGVDLDLYQHRLYVLPNWANCGWSGAANVGCVGSCRAWVRFCGFKDVFAHELGHNLSMRHASTDDDNDGNIDCSYCDISDFMGYGGQGWRQVNAPHKHQMGWLPPGQTVDLTPAGPQSHTLSALEIVPGSSLYPQVLRIPSSNETYLYVSYRVQIGYDEFMDAAYADRTSIHRSAADGSGNSLLLATLADGESFEDVDGLRITQTSHDASTTSLIVENTSVVCLDADGDGYGDPGNAGCAAGPALDCDDADPAINPGAQEVCDGLDNDCDGFADAGQDSDADTVDDLCDAFPSDGARSGPLHVGMTEPFDHIWLRVELPAIYQDPVVIVGPPSQSGYDPGVVQVKVDRTAGNAFEVRYREWLYLDGAHHIPETVAYAVMERGRYGMDDGSIWEWGSFLLSPGEPRLKTQNFRAPFPAPPALFLTVQQAKNQPNSLRAANVQNATFDAGMYEEEALTNTLTAPREIGYLAIHSAAGSGNVTTDGGALPYLLQRRAINHQFAPVLSWTVGLQEERSQDPEIYHMDTTVSMMALGRHLFGQDVTASGLDTVSLRRVDPDPGTVMEWGVIDGLDGSWATIPLLKTYANPVVVVKPLSDSQAQPGTVRLRNISGDAFQAQLSQWKYLPCCAGPEKAFYIVGESGTHDLAGLTVNIGSTTVSGTLAGAGWTPATFSTSFAEAPALFASVQSTNGGDPVVTRIDGRDATGFQVAMQEEEGGDTAHIAETVGWIAIEAGTGVLPGGGDVEVFLTLAGSDPTAVEFTLPTSRRYPTLIADIASTFDGETCLLRHAAISKDGVDLFIQEEQSWDAETFHAVEEVSVFVAE